MRVALELIYNPECNLVKGCTTEKRTKTVWKDKAGPKYSGNGKDVEVTSESDMVVFGKKKYIWLNKEECESSKTPVTMKLWSLDLPEKAEPFSENGSHNNYAEAVKLIEQCERVATEDCTDEELAMLVTVSVSKDDNYEKTTPVLSLESHKKVIDLYDEYIKSGKTEEDVEKLRNGINNIIDAEAQREDSTLDTKNVLMSVIEHKEAQVTKIIEQETELARIEEEKQQARAEKQAAFNEIKDMVVGGKGK